ncbi:GntR family transcriptional regulator [Escherichia coli]|nr:GntR family transcriptional regulator [Escherichia coli]EFE1619157.1 GntR family transcriptional regulator [Escherichia coli]
MIFQKIARLLKSEINGNSWHVGDLLPSEAELAVRYNVSRNRGRLREGAESYAKALASDILR